MIHDKDIVRDIFHRVKEVLGTEFKGEIALKLENEEQKVRKDWGGHNRYIPIGSYKKEKLKEKLRKSATVSEAVKETGLSRARIYQLWNEK